LTGRTLLIYSLYRMKRPESDPWNAATFEGARAAQTREDGIRTGCEIAREIRERINPAVAGFQVSAPFGNVDTACAVIRPNFSGISARFWT